MRRTRLADGALSTKERARLELGNQWNSRRGDTVRTMLHELGIRADVFHQWLFADEHIPKFWEAIPSVHVALQLEIASTKQQDRDFEVNDFRDVRFCEAALHTLTWSSPRGTGRIGFDTQSSINDTELVCSVGR